MNKKALITLKVKDRFCLAFFYPSLRQSTILNSFYLKHTQYSITDMILHRQIIQSVSYTFDLKQTKY